MLTVLLHLNGVLSVFQVNFMVSYYCQVMNDAVMASLPDGEVPGVSDICVY